MEKTQMVEQVYIGSTYTKRSSCVGSQVGRL